MKVLVTGGCGYVGTKLTTALLERTPHHVDVLDTMWFGNRLAPHPRLNVIVKDMRQIDEVDLSAYDTIFHLANIANDPSVELNPYSSWEVNVLAGMRLNAKKMKKPEAKSANAKLLIGHAPTFHSCSLSNANVAP